MGVSRTDAMRSVGFALAASFVTALLFLVMVGLVRFDPQPPPAYEAVESVAIVKARIEPPEPRVIDAPPMPVTSPPPADFAQVPSDWVEVERKVGFGPGPFRIATQVAAPLVAIEPIYPIHALRSDTEGWVRIRFTINPDGTVSDTYIVDAAPRHGIFDNAALGALYRSRFVPKTVQGVAVPSRAEWTFTFTKDDGV